MSERNLNFSQEQTVNQSVSTNAITEKLRNEQQRNGKLLKLYNCEMKKNQALSGALTKLKKFLEDNESQAREEEQQQDDVLTAEDAQDIVISAIQAIKSLKNSKKSQLQYTDQSIDIEIVNSQTKSLPRKDRMQKSCQCQKWKSMYLKECDQSARLSQKYISLNNHIERKQQQQKIDRNEIKRLLSDYLVLFKRYSIEENSSIVSEKKEKSSDSKRQKRSLSKGSNQKSKSRGKIASTGGQNQVSFKKQDRNPQKMKQNTQIISNSSFVDQQTRQKGQEVHSIFIIEKFKKQMECLNANLSQARKQISLKEQIIKIYRQKQRERILYENLVV